MLPLLYGVPENSPVQILVDEIEDICIKNDLVLSRWQNNIFFHKIKRITYIVHKKKYPRATRSALQIGSIVQAAFNAREGKTERCIAYKELRGLKKVLLSYIIMKDNQND